MVVPLVLLCGCASSGGLATEPHALVGTAPAPRSEPTLDGALVRLPKPGHVTVVDVWATSCGPCMKIMPAMEALYRDKRSAGLVLVGIAADDNPGLVQLRLRELGVTYPNVVDAEGQTRGAYRADRLPQTIVFDRHGRVRAVRIGGDPEDVTAVRAAVETLLGEP